VALSEREVAHFEREGWVAPQLRLPAEALAVLVRAADALAAAPAARGGAMRYGDETARAAGRELLGRVEYFQRAQPELGAFARSALVLGLLQPLLGEPPALFKDKLNYKLPGGERFAAHQDVQAGWSRYCATHLTLVVHLDASTPESGCLELARGLPRRVPIGAPWRPLEGEALAGLRFEPRPAAPGELLLFDSYVPHRSAQNRSQEPRRVLYLTFNPRSEGDHYERYFADKRAAFPPDAEREPGRRYRYRV